MNYIKQLQEDNKDLRADLALIHNDLQALFEYLHSNKFANAHENWVSVNDVLNRLQDARMVCAPYASVLVLFDDQFSK